MALNETQVTTLSDASSDSGAQIQSIFAQIFANFPYYSVLQGRSGGQVWYGGTATGEDAEIHSNTLKDGLIKLGDNNHLDETTDILTLNGSLKADTIAEKTAANGVLLDEITKIKDGTVYFNSASGGNGTISSTSHATKGKIIVGTSAYDEVNNRLGIKTTSPAMTISCAVSSTTYGGGQVDNDNAARTFEWGIADIAASSKRSAIQFRTTVGTGGSDSEIGFLTNHYGTSRAERMTIDKDGKIYFQSLTGAAAGGNPAAYYNTTSKELFYDTSSRRYKKNIKTYSGESWIDKIKVRIYDRKDGSSTGEVGIIAEELNEIKPELVCRNEKGQIESYDKTGLIPYLIKEIQELRKRVLILESK